MYDKRQRGIQQALGQVGMNANRENPYSPFGGNVPVQTLQTLNDSPMRGANTMQPQQPQMQQPQMQPQGSLRNIGIPQAQPQAPAPQLPPQQRPMPAQRQGRYPRPAQRPAQPGPSQNSLQAILRSPQFLERLRRRKAQRQAMMNPFNRSY